MATSSNQVQTQPINYSNDAPTTTTSTTTAKGPAVFDDDLFLFLPRLGDILKSYETNPNEVKTKVDELRKQFEACHEMVSRIEGIDTTVDEQRNELQRLDQELKSKSDLLKKHIQLCKFDLNMPPKSSRNTLDTDDELSHQNLVHATHPMNINDEIEEEEDENEANDDVDDDDIFQSDDQTHLHQEATHENLSAFFS